MRMLQRLAQMKSIFTWLLVLGLSCSAAGQGFGWRGDGSGRFTAALPPSQWNCDDGTGIRWTTTVGKGSSSPVIAGGKILITAEPSLLICLDRNGKVLWQEDDGLASLPAEIPPPQKRINAHADCGYATATPVVEGKHVYVSFGTGVVACHDLDGKRQWVRLFDRRLEGQYGRTASPVLAGDVLLVTVDHLVGLRRQTGETLWETADARATYGTPAVARIGGVGVAIVPHGECVRVADGRILATKLGKLVYTSPIVHEGMLYFVGEETFAVRLPDVAAEEVKLQRLWESDDVEGTFYASPICHEGILYGLSNEGTLYALDAKTGGLIYRQNLDIASASGKQGGPPANLYSSLTLVGHHLLISNDVGESLLITPGRQYRKVSHNILEKGSRASPVADGQLLLIRGKTRLYGLDATAARNGR